MTGKTITEKIRVHIYNSWMGPDQFYRDDQEEAECKADIAAFDALVRDAEITREERLRKRTNYEHQMQLLRQMMNALDAEEKGGEK